MSGVSTELISLDSPCLVEASAGTGKTHAITTYFVRAIVERGLSPDQILTVTYTKAATAELRVRTRARVVEAIAMLGDLPSDGGALSTAVREAVGRLGTGEVERRLVEALGKMDQAPILTIHGFCQRLLQDFPLLFGIDFDFQVSEDSRSIQQQMAIDFWAADLYDKPDWLLHALDAGGVNTDQLAKLANVAMRPGIEVVGPAPAEVSERDLEAWTASKRRAAELWSSRRDEILAALGNEGLYQNIYGTRVESKWAPKLDEFFAKPGWCNPPDFWKWLCQENIDIKVRKGSEAPQHPFFAECAELEKTTQTIRVGFDAEAFAFRMRFLDFARDEMRRRRHRDAILTYDDLLTAVYAPLDSSHPSHDPALRTRIISEVERAYPLALVDEFQDTDSTQYGIFRAIYGEGSAVYVGDPKQAIYAFRGADVYSYIRAVDDVAERTHVLTTNRRSDPGLVDAVNVLFSRHEPPFLLDDIRMQAATAHERSRSTFDPSLELLFLEADHIVPSIDKAVPAIVANEIGLLLQSDERIDGRSVAPDDIAVLCRSNAQACDVTEALRELHIPVSLDGDASVLNTAIASELRAVLEAALMPGDGYVVRRALLTEFLGVTPHQLSTMGDEEWSDWVSRFSAWSDTWHRYGVVRFLEDLLRDTDAESRIANHPAARRQLTDLLHLEEVLLRGERERQRDPFALMQWFRRLDEDSPDRGAVDLEELQQRPDAESGAVRVSTIHKSKGLEYGVVYVPFTWHDGALFASEKTVVKFHDSDKNLKLDLGSANVDQHREVSEREKLSEAIRLLYVAITRAKYRCTLFWGRADGWRAAALGYLLHGKLKGATHTEMELRAEVEQLAAACDAIGVREPRGERALRFESRPREGALEAREPRRIFRDVMRVASFTSLTGHDEKTPRPRAGSGATEKAAERFEELPGGARTGLMLHAVLERADFQGLESTETKHLVGLQLRSFGFDETLAGAVQRDLRTVAETPLTSEPDAPRLVDLAAKRRLRELEFTLGLGGPTLAGLADILQRHAAPASIPGYHEKLRGMSSGALQTFLRGYIDLMFEWQGRWYVADYKSNLLPSYDAQTVGEAVSREHYALQAQLYTAAAHRYLSQRVEGYEPERQWGGALFLFVRGMRGADGPGYGVFFDRQPAALLYEVDRWLGGSDASE